MLWGRGTRTWGTVQGAPASSPTWTGPLTVATSRLTQELQRDSTTRCLVSGFVLVLEGEGVGGEDKRGKMLSEWFPVDARERRREGRGERGGKRRGEEGEDVNLFFWCWGEEEDFVYCSLIPNPLLPPLPLTPLPPDFLPCAIL